MRTFSFLSIAALTLGLAACSGTQATQEPAAQPAVQDEPVVASSSQAAASQDHHIGEENVESHGHNSSSADHVVDLNEPAHGHSSSHDDSNEPPHRE